LHKKWSEKPENVYHILDTAEEIANRSMVNAPYLEELYMPEKISRLNNECIPWNKKLKSIYSREQ
jgi:hypothetical protein